MNARTSPWIVYVVQLSLAIALAFVVTSVSAPASRAQDVAFPACGDVFGLDAATGACLRVVNASSQDAGPVDVYVGDSLVAENVKYGQATDFTAIPSQSQQLRVVPTGNAVDEATVDFTNDLQPGGAYQLTVSGLTNADLSSWLSGVDVSPLPADQARVRVVHASPDLGPIDVAVDANTVPFENIELGSQSGYVPFNAGDFNFYVRQSDNNTLLLQTPQPIQIEAGMNYDIYIIGQSDAGTLEMVVFAAEVGTAASATPAANVTPVVAIGATPVTVAPGSETPVPTPTT